jgi:transcriptional regulator with XRE-family HTH domain
MPTLRVYARPILARERERKIGSQKQMLSYLKLYYPRLPLETYQKWEQGVNGVRLDRAAHISGILQIPIERLFKGEK